MMMEKSDLLEWLFQNGGPVIWQRVRAEFGFDGPALSHFELLNSPLVVKWLDRLQPGFSFNQFHGSMPTTFENAMGKLTQLGLQAGMPQFDLRVSPFLEWFRETANQPRRSDYSWEPFVCMLAAPFLARAGYFMEPSVREFAQKRLETLYRFCRRGSYEIYVDNSNYKGIPAAFQEKLLVNPELTSGGMWKIPSIYDIHLLANFPSKDLDRTVQQKIETVVGYVLDPQYQEFPEGYGILKARQGKYYTLGWSVHLPGFFGDLENHRWRRSFIQRMVLMSNFEAGRQSLWFREGLAFLEKFRTSEDRFLFPQEYLLERQSGYWVAGLYMGLEENRRRKIAFELESTFWMLKIINRSER